MYVIPLIATQDDDEPLYWNNETGWGDWLSATVFTSDERDHFNLPIDGTWRQITNN